MSKKTAGFLKVSTGLFILLSFLTTPLAPVFAADINSTPAPATSTIAPDAIATPDAASSAVSTPAPVLPAPFDPLNLPGAPAAPTAPRALLTPGSVPGSKSATPIAGGETTPVVTSASTSSSSSSTSGLDPLFNANTPSSTKNLIPQPNQTTGALVYSYPTTLPAGRNGLTPNVTLQYDSQDTIQDTILGYGWSANTPYISRLNKKGASTVFTDTTFTSSISGELVNSSGTSYVARVDNGDFLTYTFSANTWTVTDKSGTVYTYGSQASTRQDDPNDSTKIYKWMLEKTQDTNGNIINYTYIKDQGQIYPSTITYGGIYVINFTYETRPDTSVVYSKVFAVTTAKRLLQIEVTTNAIWNRHYNFIYSISPSSGRSLIQSITESGKNTAGTVTTLPSMTFTYQQGTTGTTAQTSNWVLPTINWNGGYQNTQAYDTTLSFATSGGAANGKVIDVNGDGLPDIVYSQGYLAAGANNVAPQVWLNNGSGWTLSSTWSFPTAYTYNSVNYTFSTANTYYSSVKFVDVNSDGLMDVITGGSGNMADSTSTKNAVYLNTGSGWAAAPSWNLPMIWTDGTNNFTVSFNQQNDTSGNYGNPVKFTDINGDGRVDIVYATGCVSDPCSNVYARKSAVILNTGSGWNIDPAWQFSVFPGTTVSTNFAPFYSASVLFDVNGDGLPDIIDNSAVQASVCGFANGGYMKNTGSGWTFDPCWDHLHFPSYWPRAQIADVNNDGLPDLIIGATGAPAEIGTYLNNGTGWIPTTSWPESFVFDVESGVDTNDRVLDANSDNLNDVLHGNASNVTTPNYLANTTSQVFNHSSTWNPGILFLTGNGVAGGDLTQPYDLNNDSIPDYIYTDYNGCLYEATHCPIPSQVFLTSGAKSDILSSITIPTGAVTNLTYKQQFIKNNSTPAEAQNQPIYVVSSISTNDGNGVISTDTYTYGDGSFYSGVPGDRKFAGFDKVTQAKSNGTSIVSYYHQGNGTNAANYEYSDNYGKIGYVYRTDVLDSGSSLVSRTTTEYGSSNPTTGSYFIYPIQTVNENSGVNTAQTFTYNTTNGNLTSAVDYGLVTVTDPLTFTDTGADKKTVNYTYATNGAIYKVSDQTTLDQSSTKVNETRNYYDTLALGSVTKGNNTKTEQWKVSSTYVNTQKTYNSFGNVLTSTDERSKVTNYAYDTNNLYPATVTDPMTRTTQYVYDYTVGKPSQITDQNSLVYQTSYDGLGRVLQEKIPDFTTPFTPVTKTTYTYTDTSGAVAVQRTDYLDSTNSADTYQYFDGLGRLIQERKEAEIASNFNVSDTVYNNVGLVQKQSLKYTSSGAAKTSPTSDTTLYTSNTYDALNRILTAVNALGTTTYVYTGVKTAITDANSKQKAYYKDAYGNLVKVDEVNAGTTYTTNYTWDLNGKLLSITDSSSNVRNFTYDGVGRRLTAQDLHASADATFGTWTYTYDDAGNITQSVSPLSQTVNYVYDNVNRVTSEDYTGGAGTEITYTYDSCTKGIGKLCTSTVASGAASVYTYDALGNIATDQETINATVYTTSYTYDRQGNTLTITYPDSAQAKYTFNTAGLLEKIERKESGGSFTDVVSNFDYNPMDQVVTQADANGVNTTNTYDATKMYRLTRKFTQNTVNSLVKALVVGGGGGGGGNSGGGGGAGGYQYNAAFTVFSQAYPIVVGAGGNGAAGSGETRNGHDSSFSTITGTAGGGGGYGNDGAFKNGENGGSGGGGGGNSSLGTTGGTGTQGSNGGTSGAGFAGAGGGGNVSAGSISTAANGGNGGNGISNSISGTAVTYSGGGGGGASTTGGTGGTGGGGSGSGYNTPGIAGTANTGGGGGGQGANGNNGGGNGGSGVVIIAYHTDGSDGVSPSSTGGTITTAGGYTIHTFTSSGTFTAVTSGGSLVKLQDLNYTYDNVGNVTQLIDASNTNSSKTANYVYDDLYRLTSATITAVASGQSTYTQAFTYDALGNILTGPIGTYLYQGNTGVLKANPHAATSINGVTYTYDADGNLTTNGTLTNTWNYRDQLTQTVTGGVTSNDYYDAQGNRVQYKVGSTITYYPNKYYNISGTKKTKQVYAGDQLVATIENNSGTITPYYNHTDQLNSVTSVSNTSGTLTETLDYYPYGNQRISSGTYTGQRQYIGQIYDSNTNLDYLNARFYKADVTRFISEDPVFWEIGQTKDGRNALLDPQAQNSYSYANNNPIIKSDPTGRVAGIDDLAIITSPEWLPWVITGATAIATSSYYATKNLVQNISRGSSTPARIKPIDPAKFGFGQPPMGPEDWKPNMDNKPKWMKWTFITATAASVAADIAQMFKDTKDEANKVTNTPDQKNKPVQTTIKGTNIKMPQSNNQQNKLQIKK